VYRIAFLGSTSPSGYASQVAAFRGGLRDFGYREGRNLVIDFRWALGHYERLPKLAAELVPLLC
jgi:putative ABC transport system substrate-binding protein